MATLRLPSASSSAISPSPQTTKALADSAMPPKALPTIPLEWDGSNPFFRTKIPGLKPLKKRKENNALVAFAQDYINTVTATLDKDGGARFQSVLQKYLVRYADEKQTFVNVYSLFYTRNAADLMDGLMRFFPESWRKADLEWLKSAARKEIHARLVRDKRGQAPSPEEAGRAKDSALRTSVPPDLGINSNDVRSSLVLPDGRTILNTPEQKRFPSARAVLDAVAPPPNTIRTDPKAAHLVLDKRIIREMCPELPQKRWVARRVMTEHGLMIRVAPKEKDKNEKQRVISAPATLAKATKTAPGELTANVFSSPVIPSKGTAIDVPFDGTRLTKIARCTKAAAATTSARAASYASIAATITTPPSRTESKATTPTTAPAYVSPYTPSTPSKLRSSIVATSPGSAPAASHAPPAKTMSTPTKRTKPKTITQTSAPIRTTASTTVTPFEIKLKAASAAGTPSASNPAATANLTPAADADTPLRSPKRRRTPKVKKPSPPVNVGQTNLTAAMMLGKTPKTPISSGQIISFAANPSLLAYDGAALRKATVEESPLKDKGKGRARGEGKAMMSDVVMGEDEDVFTGGDGKRDGKKRKAASMVDSE